MQVVVAQHELGDVVGHRREQLVAFLACHVFLLGDVTEQDFDIHFAIRAVDARRVVNEISIDAPPGKAVLHASELRQAEVATFADNLAA